jgi:hypothetical protein
MAVKYMHINEVSASLLGASKDYGKRIEGRDSGGALIGVEEKEGAE